MTLKPKPITVNYSPYGPASYDVDLAAMPDYSAVSTHALLDIMKGHECDMLRAFGLPDAPTERKNDRPAMTAAELAEAYPLDWTIMPATKGHVSHRDVGAIPAALVTDLDVED